MKVIITYIAVVIYKATIKSQITSTKLFTLFNNASH
jgi:hypothetical protein